MGLAGTRLSKIDVNLQGFKKTWQDHKGVDLFLNSDTKPNKVKDQSSDYSNTLRLISEDYVCFHFLAGYSVLSLYSLGNAVAGRTLNIHLPSPMLNSHHTFTIREIKGSLVMELILNDGLYLLLTIPVNCVMDMITEIPENWFKVLNPYDFTIRRPHYIYSVSEIFTVAFLEDGGLVGLSKIENESGESDVTPALFNDNSYLQGLGKILFSRRNAVENHIVVSCALYRDRFLITLTQGCRLKIWDLEKQAVMFEKHLAVDEKHAKRVYETMGQFLSLHDDMLVIFLPFENGIFQMWDLRLDTRGDLVLKAGSTYRSNLSSSSIWSLVDMKLTKPMGVCDSNSFLDLVVLWRSNRVVKLQLLVFLDDALQKHEWIEATNQSLVDLRSDFNLLTNGDTNQAVMNLKAHYTPSLFKVAQRILSDSGVLMSPDSPYSQEYLLNLQSILKDLKKRNEEPSSLTMYQDGLLLVNSLSLYSHSFYKPHSLLESSFYNKGIDSSSGNDLKMFLRTIDGFADTISPSILADISRSLVEAVSTCFPTEIPIKEKFTEIYSTHLNGHTHLANLKKLYEDLNQFDVIAILDTFLEQTTEMVDLERPLIDAIYPNSLLNAAVMESTHQAILIQNNFVINILLIFAFMDFDCSAFLRQINTLLALHYKQSLWIHLYRLDKDLLASQTFSRTSKFGKGTKISTSAEWSSTLAVILKEVYKMAVSPNPLFIEAFDTFVTSGAKSAKSCELYLTTVQQKFSIHSNVAHEFMLGLSYFMCGKYDRAFEFLQKHSYPDVLLQELPDRLYMPLQKDGHLWCDVIGSFKLPNKHSAYYYNLAKLFSVVKSFEYALLCAKKSIKLSTEYGDIEETLVFRNAQLLQYLEILMVFSNYEEILEVLSCSPEIISQDVKASYYRRLLLNLQHRDAFFSIVLKLCCNADGLYLPSQDYSILDTILCGEVDNKDWDTYKRVYSFRLMNGQDRAAAEILYDYLQKSGDLNKRKRCYYIIINILSSFSHENDHWILTNGRPVTLKDLKAELAVLEAQ
ncbi:LADA_0G08768g1_1 [Lachancea dasiensis]|uniref:LADA_0G08768g1_1 n=1 Tax=Lachancea dasiensis TaxID=1072105 RepID=A0A1G4JU55_9SACH|nr:LADA_0G08768g1_1 [Lachancea dasiensis]